MEIIRDLASLRTQVATWRGAGAAIGLVPTMGALHEGHLSLVHEVRKAGAERVVTSIFVNPTQFAPNEDFKAYPRQEADDIAQLEALNVDAVYMPPVEVMYPAGFGTDIIPRGSVVADLEAAARPTHFTGVATIVAKLFNQCTPDFAVFGEKDYQQLRVIQQMVRDLDMNIEIVAAPIIRDEAGLALSSRNAYFDAEQLGSARQLNVVMKDIVSGVLNVDAAATKLLGLGFEEVDYLTVRDAETLAKPTAGRAQRLLAAVRLGPVRLIDNMGMPV